MTCVSRRQWRDQRDYLLVSAANSNSGWGDKVGPMKRIWVAKCQITRSQLTIGAVCIKLNTSSVTQSVNGNKWEKSNSGKCEESPVGHDLGPLWSLWDLTWDIVMWSPGGKTWPNRLPQLHNAKLCRCCVCTKGESWRIALFGGRNPQPLIAQHARSQLDPRKSFNGKWCFGSFHSTWSSWKLWFDCKEKSNCSSFTVLPWLVFCLQNLCKSLSCNPLLKHHLVFILRLVAIVECIPASGWH